VEIWEDDFREQMVQRGIFPPKLGVHGLLDEGRVYLSKFDHAEVRDGRDHGTVVQHIASPAENPSELPGAATPKELLATRGFTQIYLTSESTGRDGRCDTDLWLTFTVYFSNST
jgi:hypothetical protein